MNNNSSSRGTSNTPSIRLQLRHKVR